MRRTVTLGLCFCLLVLQVPSADACGDKLLVLGRTIRIRSAGKPAAILAYAQPGSPVAAMLEDPQWLAASRKGKYHVQPIQDLGQLAQLLNREHFDLVLADFSEAAQVQEAVRSVSAIPLIVPVVDDSKEKVRAAQKRYGVVVKERAKAGAYAAAIEDALDLKAGVDEARARSERRKKS